MKSLNSIALYFTFITFIASSMIGGVCAFGQSDSTQIKKDSILTDANYELRLQELKAEIMQLQKQIDKYDKDKKQYTKQIVTNRIAGGVTLCVMGLSLFIGGSKEESGILTVPLYISGFVATIPGLILILVNINKMNKLKNQERQQSKVSYGIQSNGIGIAYKF